MIQLQDVLFSLLLIPAFAHSFEAAPHVEISDSQIQEVAHSKAWMKLMHYRPNMWGHLRSDVDGKGFFFSKDGFTNPENELKASLKALYSKDLISKIKMPVRCAFPERSRFLNEKFNLGLETLNCEKLNQFMDQFHDPQSVSIVFSSAYPNNPASMFGHTFLKINSARSTDLLDMGLNFAAVVADDENGFAFVWLGTTGGYVGQWSVQPYYVKVREYSNFESRDLWEYKLGLTREETLRLIHHVWELEMNSYFDYYFFDENCSYQILAAIEAIHPEWTLLKHKIDLIPGESVKFVVSNENAVQEVKYRPSLFNRINSRYRLLTDDEKKTFHDVLEKKTKPEEVQSRMSADALLTYFDYLKNDRPKDFEARYTDELERLRKTRASLGLLTKEEESRVPRLEGRTRPDWGHDAVAMSLGTGYLSTQGSFRDSGFLSFKLKSAYHDLLDYDLGYTPYAHIDFPYVEVRYFQKPSRWTLEELGGIGTTSLTPVTQLKTPISFRALVNYQRFDLKNSFDLHAIHGEIGGGLSFFFLGEENRVYAMALAHTDLSPRFQNGYRMGPGLEMGLLLNPIEKYKFQVLTRSTCDLVYSNKCYSNAEYQLNQSYFVSKNQELRNTNKLKDSAEKRGTTTFETNFNYVWFFN